MAATSNNFADALFILAREENKIDDFFADLCLIDETIKREPEYLQFMSAPSIPKAQRIGALEQAFGGKINLYVLSFLQLLCEKEQFRSLADIIADFSALREFAGKTVKATVRSAVALSPQQEKALIFALEKRSGKNVILKKIVDKSVLGGLTVELDGSVLDGSVKTNLKLMKDVISV